MIIVENTPVEKYIIQDKTIFVKREDLSCVPPGPPFSKMRGLMKVLKGLKQQGITTIGYTETSISMAGWGVAYGCFILGLQCILFDPQYKNTPPLLSYHRKQWKKFNAKIIPLKAGMAKVNWNISRRELKKESNSILLPLGLPFLETIEETTKEVVRTRQAGIDPNTIIVNVGSGTIAAGIIKGFEDKKVYGIMGRTGNVKKKLLNILKKSSIINQGLFNKTVDFELIDPCWEYTERSEISCPFPCHPFYDLKAWQWLMENIEKLESPILFWNIGRIK